MLSSSSAIALSTVNRDSSRRAGKGNASAFLSRCSLRSDSVKSGSEGWFRRLIMTVISC